MSDNLYTTSSSVKLQISGYVFLTFIGYLIIGYSLAVLPVFIHHDLGYSAIVAGFVISIQYLATFLFRGVAGGIVDKKGPKPAVMLSMISFIISGIFMITAGYFEANHHLSLAILIITRLITGVAEGMVGASPVNWAMLQVGDQHTATAISYNGIASYGALAIGAPSGVYLAAHFGIEGLGVAILITAIGGLLLTRIKPALKETKQTERHSFMKVFRIISPFGTCLALGGLGFGTISTFITLYYQFHKWDNGVLCLTIFGAVFILCRVLFGNSIMRYGGMKVAIVSLLFEAAGLAVLAMADSSLGGLVGAGLSGLGFSLVFPALGVEAVNLVPASNKGSALAAYGVFIDISLGITGPLVGLIADTLGMNYIFQFAAVVVTIGLIIAVIQQRRIAALNTSRSPY